MPAHTRASMTSLSRVREAVKAPRRTGFVAERAEGNLVGAEEVLERLHERRGRAAVARGVVGEGRREERRRVADRCRWVEQRQPRRVGLGRRVAVGVGLADRRDRTPELPVGTCRSSSRSRRQRQPGSPSRTSERCQRCSSFGWRPACERSGSRAPSLGLARRSQHRSRPRVRVVLVSEPSSLISLKSSA